MRDSNYLKALGYGVMPFCAISYIFYTLNYCLLKGNSVDLMSVANAISIILCTLAAVMLIKRNKNRGIFLTLAIVSSILRLVIHTLINLGILTGTDLIINIVGNGIESILCVIWLVYSLLHLKKLDTSEVQVTESNPYKHVILKSLLLSVALIVIISSVLSDIDILYSCLYKLFASGVKNLLIQKRIDNIMFAISRFTLIGFGIWTAFVFDKIELVFLNSQGFGRKKKPVLSVFAGIGVALVLIALVAVCLKIMGCGFSVNKMNYRIYIAMACSVLNFAGVAVSEEITCRGILLGFCEQRNKRIWGILLSSFIFTIIHFITGAYDKFPHFVFLFASGILFAALKMYNNNIWLSIGYHFMYDWSVTHLLEIRSLNNKESFFSALSYTNWKMSLSVTIPCLILAAIFFFLAYAKKKRIIETD